MRKCEYCGTTCGHERCPSCGAPNREKVPAEVKVNLRPGGITYFGYTGTVRVWETKGGKYGEGQ